MGVKRAGSFIQIGDIAGFSVWWFFISLIPVSNIFYILPFYMAEHYLYVPSLGFFLLLGKGLGSMYNSVKFRNLAIFLASAILATYCYLTIKQNGYWLEPISFYERTLKYAPDSFRVYTKP